MTLARSGLKSDTVSDLGGLTGALEYLRKRDATAGKLAEAAEIFSASQTADGEITDIVEFERGTNLVGETVVELDDLAAAFESSHQAAIVAVVEAFDPGGDKLAETSWPSARRAMLSVVSLDAPPLDWLAVAADAGSKAGETLALSIYRDCLAERISTDEQPNR